MPKLLVQLPAAPTFCESTLLKKLSLTLLSEGNWEAIGDIKWSRSLRFTSRSQYRDRVKARWRSPKLFELLIRETEQSQWCFCSTVKIGQFDSDWITFFWSGGDREHETSSGLFSVIMTQTCKLEAARSKKDRQSYDLPKVFKTIYLNQTFLFSSFFW